MMASMKVADVRKALKKCCDAYNDLITASNNIDLHEITKTIFPPLKCAYSSELSFQFGDPMIFGGISEKELTLCVEFPRKKREEVLDWFADSNYEDYTLSEINFSTWMLEIPVNHILEVLTQNEIIALRKECEDIAKPFLEYRESEVLAEYEEKCLKDDPYYIGVHFVSYDGDYPTYCMGNVILEIEGVAYSFYLPNITKGFGYTREIDENKLPPNLKRYYHEIQRVIDNKLHWGCCGGCE